METKVYGSITITDVIDGKDGDSISYKYYLSNSLTVPTYTASTSGWTDEPRGVSESNQYEYVVQIKTASSAIAKKINTHQRNFPQSGSGSWEYYGTIGHQENWTTGTKYDNSHISIGDLAYVTGTIRDTSTEAKIYGKVINIVDNHITMISVALVIGDEKETMLTIPSTVALWAKWGEKGDTLYTWHMYADDKNGSGMTSDSTGKAYVGVAYNQATAEPPDNVNPSIFTWSLWEPPPVTVEKQIAQYCFGDIPANKNDSPTAPAQDDSGWSTTAPNPWDEANLDDNGDPKYYVWRRQETHWSSGDTTYVGLMILDDYEVANVLAQQAGYKNVGEWCSEQNITIIDGSTIMTGSIAADKINVDNLSAISANMGTVTAGVIQSQDYHKSVMTIWGNEVSESEQPSEGLTFTLGDDGTYYSVTGIGTCTDTNIIVPATYEGLPVTTVANRSFSSNQNISSIYLPDSITSIGGSAFYRCSSLTSVYIPDSVTSIAGSVFSYCSSLTSIAIPDGVTSINASTFYSCSSLTSITIPDSVTSIGENAFTGCTSLTSITIPDSVTSIGKSAFYGCSGLTSITIPDSVTTIGDRAFRSCDSLTSIIIGKSVMSIGVNIFDGCPSLSKVYYADTEDAWNSITINANNDILSSAVLYYYSKLKPRDEGNYWHYTNTCGFRISCDDKYLIDTKNFTVTPEGDVNATNGSFTGTVNATNGTIANWLISENKLSNRWQDESGVWHYNDAYFESWGEGKGSTTIHGSDLDIKQITNSAVTEQSVQSIISTWPPASGADDDIDGLHFSRTYARGTVGGNQLYGSIGWWRGAELEYPTTGEVIAPLKMTARFMVLGDEGTNLQVRATQNMSSASVTSSWRGAKYDIEPLSDKYSVLLKNLKPVRFKYNNGQSERYHTGFVLDGLKDAMDVASVDPSEFAAYCVSNEETGEGGIRYSELIALCVNEIQQLSKRVEELENKLNTQQND